ncbi:MAG: head GIN domain-containing protein [Bacteroidota bacterium]
MRFLKILFYGFLIMVALGFFLKGKAFEFFGIGDEDIVVSEVFDESDMEANGFDEIFISGNFKVILAQENDYEINVNASQELKPYIVVNQNGDRLEVKLKKGFSVRKMGKAEIFIASPKINHVKVSGGVELKTRNAIKTERLELEVSGAGDVSMEVEADRFETHLSGAGSMDLKGKSDVAEISISGAGKVNAFDLLTDRLEVHVSGAGLANVHARDELDVHVSGAASLRYKGSPRISQSISGAGSVRSAD